MFDLYSLLWEREVGSRLREHERAEERKAAALAAQYQKSARDLQRRQEE